MWEKFIKIITLPDLRRKIVFVLILLLIARILAHIPLPGVDLPALQDFFQRNQLFGLLNMFSGGAMENFSIILMGVGPYITASIIIQLLTVVIPSLEQLQKEGEWGQQKINQYTRYLTVPLAILQSYAMLNLLKSQQIIPSWDVQTLATMLISITAGSLLLMWLGELISENGIGNGISLIITLGIISGLPTQVRNTVSAIQKEQVTGLAIFGAVALLTVVVIVLINDAKRKIPVSYARRVRSGASGGAIDTYLPLSVNAGGVIPIIFANSLMLFPGILGRFFSHARSAAISSIAGKVSDFFQNNTYYAILYFILVILFTFFYVGIIFKPNQVAENLQKQGGFIPGIRPGSETSSFLSKVSQRITFFGAMFLAVIAVLPFIVQSATGITTLALGGTGILIMVSVILETARQIQAQLAMRTYELY